MNNEREKLGSRIGFILLSAGCAIGLGNVWTFPWRTGNNGGAAFVLLYIIAVIVLGVPVMTAEFSLGRAAQTSPIKMHKALEKPNQKWHKTSWLSLLGNVGLMMFYTTIAGYFVYYLVTYIGGGNESLNFDTTMQNLGVSIGYNIFVIVLGFVIISTNLQKGIEKITKFVMLGLFALLIIIAIHSLTLSGAKEGLSFYLKPDFSTVTIKTVIAAMNQAFFSLSLGIGSMAIFGSYINKDRALLGESIFVCSLDTLVALLAGVIIFPACFTYGIQPDAGPSLLFNTMVTVFNGLKGGRIWGAAFFLFMFFAALSTVIAVFENICAMVRDLTNWDRKKTSIILCIVMLILTIPMAISGVYDIQLFSGINNGATGTLDILDYIVETFAQPLGSFLFLIFACSKRYGWGWDNLINEANSGTGLKVKKWMKPIFFYITPTIIFILWLYGLITYSY